MVKSREMTTVVVPDCDVADICPDQLPDAAPHIEALALDWIAYCVQYPTSAWRVQYKS